MSSLRELILVRHGMTARPEVLCGRTDVPLSDTAMDGVPPAGAVGEVWVSPAKRAVSTAKGFWPNRKFHQDERLWEQDFGDWDGRAYADLPDIGALDRDALAEFKPDRGESFLDVQSRVEPSLLAASERTKAVGSVALVAHAGIVRAALSLALKNRSVGLSFEIAHLSATRLRCMDGGEFSILAVNAKLS